MEIDGAIYSACVDDDVDYFFELVTLDDLKNTSQENKNELLYSCFANSYIYEFKLARIFLDIGANINFYVNNKNDTIIWKMLQSIYDVYFQELGTEGEDIQVYEIKDIIFLLKNGADPNIKGIFCTKHKTCLDIAIELYNLDNNKFKKYVDLLREYGAKTSEELDKDGNKTIN